MVAALYDLANPAPGTNTGYAPAPIMAESRPRIIPASLGSGYVRLSK